ncbi:putative glycosyl transferase [Golovinomyces cichoracearum]|uniref:Putative glycosyl transferase n=1 Tax=Golovinomyces cichoracearum TaxID=62708 RepID=A0A420HCB0_9PEZI|nr:putative glycosyl transferase [Golovinomyces cichoracearum]
MEIKNENKNQSQPLFLPSPESSQQNSQPPYAPNKHNPITLHGIYIKNHTSNALPNPEEMIEKTYNGNTYQGFSRESMSLNKIYSEDNKYGGLPTESFIYKFSILIDLASKSEIPQDVLPTAFSTMLKGMALEYYYSCEEHRRNMLQEWNKISLRDMFHKNPSKEERLVFNEMVQTLRAMQRGLDREYHTDSALRNKIISACSNIPACSSAILQQTHSISALCNNIYAAIEYNETAIRAESSDSVTSAYLTDRRFHERNQGSRQNTSHDQSSHSSAPPSSGPKKCFVCRQVGCWSTNHSHQERTKARARFTKAVKAYILEHDQSGDDENNIDDTEALALEIDEYSIHEDRLKSNPNCFYTSISKVTAQDAKNHFQLLANYSTYHTLTHDILSSDYVLVENRYSSERSHGIMLDTGPSFSSVAGFGQVQAYLAEFDA